MISPALILPVLIYHKAMEKKERHGRIRESVLVYGNPEVGQAMHPG
jgi:hypothetical protein